LTGLHPAGGALPVLPQARTLEPGGLKTARAAKLCGVQCSVVK
jgi:hypothetical protein